MDRETAIENEERVGRRTALAAGRFPPEPITQVRPTLEIASHSNVGQAGLAFVAASLLSFVLTAWLSQNGAFATYDRLFETDPNSRIEMMASGWQSGEAIHWLLPNSVHPLLGYLFSPFVRVAAFLLATIGVAGDALQLRNTLVLAVVPLASGVSAACASLILSSMGCSGVRLALFNALSVFAFSNITFGSIPDHFALSRTAALAVLLLLTLQLVKPPRPRHRALWWVLGIVAAGITVTNAAFVATTRACLEWARGRSIAGGVGRGLWIAAVSLLVAIAIGTTLHIVRYGVPERDEASHVTGWLHAPSPARIAAVISAIGESFVPLKLVDYPARWKDRTWPTIVPASSLQVQFSAVLIGLLLLALTAWGAWRMARRGGPVRWVAWASVMQFVALLPLVTLWGGTPILYSQHWLAGQQILLGGLFLADRHGRRSDLGTAAGVALLAATLIATIVALRFIMGAVVSPLSAP